VGLWRIINRARRDTWGFITLFLYQLRYVYSTIQVIRLLIIINERDSFRRNQLHIMMELDRKSIYYPIISLQCIMMMMMIIIIIIIICSNSSSNNNSNIQWTTQKLVYKYQRGRALAYTHMHTHTRARARTHARINTHTNTHIDTFAHSFIRSFIH